MAYNSRRWTNGRHDACLILLPSRLTLQRFHAAFSLQEAACYDIGSRHSSLNSGSRLWLHLCGNTVGAVIPTAPAFRLADSTADRDSHPALKICRCKLKQFSQIPTLFFRLKLIFNTIYNIFASLTRRSTTFNQPGWRNR